MLVALVEMIFTYDHPRRALIRAWPLLGQWAESFRPFMRWRDRELDGLWRSWVAHDEDPQLLLPFGMLDEARRWMADYEAELSASHVRYITASIEAHQAHTAAREEGVSEELCRHERTGVSCRRTHTAEAGSRWRIASPASSGASP